LYSNVCGGDIAWRMATMDYDDGIEFVLRFVKEQTQDEMTKLLLYQVRRMQMEIRKGLR
jgi:hypothetical protein